MTRADATADNGGPVKIEPASTSVRRALQLLDCFRIAGPCLGVSEIARISGLPKSTAFRLLGHLERGGFVERHEGGYRVSLRVFELGSHIITSQHAGMREACFPYLVDLHVRTEQTVHLGVLEGADVVYLEKIHGHNSRPTPTALGTRMPAHCVALGKAILAFSSAEKRNAVLAGPLTRRTPFSIVEPGRLGRNLEQIRSSGLALDREECALGLVCVAAPLLDGDTAWGAISVSGGSHMLDVRVCGTHVAATAARVNSISRLLQQSSDTELLG
ncbi:IclR family transcriptional regulator [Mycobacterium colombiense]|uniref:IclR family transcriptional regulator n=1 Tax=Mycobacterium colombiense TaxID=339268 RepID=UPI00200A0DED|nr:IclR family transcriptional regulator [Mycobacterium colombiense]MCK8647125.1 IclR family transcriptional regulator [Mycobacterium colombiense]